MSDDEEKLKRAFSALKAEDAKKAPVFRTIVDRGAPKKRSPWVVLVPLASTAAIAAVFLVWCGTSTMSAPAPTAAAPTVAANQKNQPADEAAHAAAGGEPAAAAAAGGKKASADGITAAVADFHPPPDPAPLDFLLALPGSSALATNTALDLPVLR